MKVGFGAVEEAMGPSRWMRGRHAPSMIGAPEASGESLGSIAGRVRTRGSTK